VFAAQGSHKSALCLQIACVQPTIPHYSMIIGPGAKMGSESSCFVGSFQILFLLGNPVWFELLQDNTPSERLAFRMKLSMRSLPIMWLGRLLDAHFALYSDWQESS